MSNWVTLKKLKKNKIVKITSTGTATTRCYLPNYTRGIKWKNSLALVGNLGFQSDYTLDTLNTSISKVDDNTFNVNTVASAYSVTRQTYSVFVKSGGSWVVNPTLAKGLVIDSFSEIICTIVLTIIDTRSGAKPAVWNIEVFVNDGSVFKRGVIADAGSGGSDEKYVTSSAIFASRVNTPRKVLKIKSIGAHTQNYVESKLVISSRFKGTPTNYTTENSVLFAEIN